MSARFDFLFLFILWVMAQWKRCKVLQPRRVFCYITDENSVLEIKQVSYSTMWTNLVLLVASLIFLLNSLLLMIPIRISFTLPVFSALRNEFRKKMQLYSFSNQYPQSREGCDFWLLGYNRIRFHSLYIIWISHIFG